MINQKFLIGTYMKVLLSAFLALCLTSVSLPAYASDSKELPLISYDQLKSLIKDQAKNSLHIYDANNPKTRSEKGLIPGAIALSSAGDYDVAKELPKDHAAALVFYCYNPKCTASHTAANKAIGAGYKNVSVFSDGIVGWAEHGEKVQAAS